MSSARGTFSLSEPPRAKRVLALIALAQVMWFAPLAKGQESRKITVSEQSAQSSQGAALQSAESLRAMVFSVAMPALVDEPHPPPGAATPRILRFFLPLSTRVFEPSPLLTFDGRSALRSANAVPKGILGLRLPTFIAFGVGGLGVSAAVATHLAAGMSAQYGDPRLGCTGHCASKTSVLATTSAICAGIAAAGIGTGIVLVLFEPEHARPLAPAIKMSLSGSKAAASASWSF